MERANGYLETSFLPGRSFGSPQDFNAQLTSWLDKANNRVHRGIDAKPAERWEPDRAAMLPLPPVPPQVGWHTVVRLPRDHYVRLDANDYSVDPSVIGRRVQVHADLALVRVHCSGRLVAVHQRCWARGQSVTDRRMHRPPPCYGSAGWQWCHRSKPRCSNAIWPTTTATPRRRWQPDGHQDQHRLGA